MPASRKSSSDGPRKPADAPVPPPSAREALGRAMLRAALGDEGLARVHAGDRAVAVAIAAPEPWHELVRSTLEEAHPPFLGFALEQGADPAVLEAAFLDAITDAHSVYAIAPMIEALPDGVRDAADLCATVGMPGAAVLRAAVRVFTGTDPGPLPDGICYGVDPLPILATFRIGSPAAQIVERLGRLRPPPPKAPPPPPAPVGPRLEELHGYGEAAEWGLGLRDAVADCRAGRMTFREIPEPAAVLVGPPGTGKTTFAKALAVTCGIPLIESSVGAWFASSAGYLDSVIKKATDVMREARTAAAADPSGVALLFLDELDGIPDRGSLTGRGRDWWSPVVGHVLGLVEINAPSRQGIILLGATNHGDRLEPALVRPGRFGRLIEIRMPDAAALAGILGTHAPELDEADRTVLAALLVGRSGADVASLAVRARATAGGHLDAAALAAALLPPDGLSPAERRSVAVHEVGHALVSEAVGYPVDLVSIVGEPGSHGHVVGRVRLVLAGRERLEALATVALAGRAADVLFGSGPHGSAEADLLEATAVVARLHASQGLGETLVSMPPHAIGELLARIPELRATVDADLHRLHARAEAILAANRPAHARLVELLLARRLVPGDAARAAMGRLRLPAGGGCRGRRA